jgi:hypothetical protein
MVSCRDFVRDAIHVWQGTWSAPSAIGTAGMGLGTQAGAEMTDVLIVLNSISVSRVRSSALLLVEFLIGSGERDNTIGRILVVHKADDDSF